VRRRRAQPKQARRCADTVREPPAPERHAAAGIRGALPKMRATAQCVACASMGVIKTAIIG
jgi:hypothetical protein